MGGPRSETGADHREGEAEHGKDAEAEDQGIGQVHADGGHHVVDEQPAVRSRDDAAPRAARWRR
jgi:hypothetical protein